MRYCWRQLLHFAVTQTGPYTTIILTYHTKTHTSHQHLQIHITYLQTAIPLNPVHTDTLRLQIRILWRHNTKHNVTCSLPKCKHNYANHNTNTTFAKYKHNPEYNIKKLIFHNINTRQAYRCQLHTISGSMMIRITLHYDTIHSTRTTNISFKNLLSYFCFAQHCKTIHICSLIRHHHSLYYP